MKERPFNAYPREVRAILEGQMTQFRRPVKPQPPNDPTGRWTYIMSSTGKITKPFCYGVLDEKGNHFTDRGQETQFDYKCPFGQPGERLWVKETWNMADKDRELIYGETYGPEASWKGSSGKRKITWVAVYKATFPEGIKHPEFGEPRWRPSIHMPRWASRILLEIDEIKVERVQNITEYGAQCEGCLPCIGLSVCGGGCQNCESDHPKEWFKNTWDSIYSNRGLGWCVNPYVWVTKFHRI